MAQKSKMMITILSLVIFSSPAWSYKKAKCFVIKPPTQILAGVKRIAVLDFQTEGVREEEKNAQKAEDVALDILSDIIKSKTEKPADQIDYGRKFSDLLISELIKDDRGIYEIQTGIFGLGSGKEGKALQEGSFTNVFGVVERSQLLQVIEEQKLSAAGFVNENEAIQLGNMLGVQAIVTGNVSINQKDSEYKEKRTEKKNGKNVTKEVNCKRREVKFSVNARIVSTETGQVLGSTESSEMVKESACDDSYKSLPPVDALVDKAVAKCSKEILDYFSPYYEKTDFELQKVKAKQFKDVAEKAAEFAEELQLNEAYAIYKAIYEKDAYQPEVLYNLGLLNEVVGNFDDAKEFTAMALQLKDEGDYKKAMQRIEKNVAFAEALEQMGIVIAEHSFEISAAEMSRAIAKKVKVKGSRDDRIAVYSKADASSEVVAKVPGELTFTTTAQEGNFFFIDLLGGKQGYISKDQVDLQN